MTAFSLTVPLTRLAVGGLSPLFIGCGRAVLAAAIAGTALIVARAHLPAARQWVRLAVVAGGVVIGFPLMTTFALQTASAGHAAVVIALLPAATAVVAVLRGRERPARSFWVFAALGAAAAVGFAAMQGPGTAVLGWSDLLLLGAVVAAAIGYAEGGLLARELGAWQTIAWALVLAASLMVALTALSAWQHPPTASPVHWLAFAYLGVVSMFLAFIPWYRGLSIGPMARVSQVQLVQPVLSLGWAVLLLGEHLGWADVAGAAAVIGCAALAVRSRLTRRGA